VLAARVHAGAAATLGDATELLPDKRFFSGGAVSHRGFQRRRLGPKDATGEPVGGNSLLELSTEWRLRVVGPLRAALFVDVGQVWALVEDMRPREMEVGLGPALMVGTPIGPIRADLGFRVTDTETEEPRTVFHFLIGHPY
jgi:outer membrane translocation and assembly module TamA